MGIDLNNMNQILSKPEFFAINAIEASYEVKAVLLPDKVTSLVKTGIIRMDYYYIGENYISPRAWMTI